nr:histidine kinase [uncultured Sellimonas sp.]
MRKIKHFTIKPQKTSRLILFSFLCSMMIMFFVISSMLYRHLSNYVLNQSSQYTNSIAEQIQQRLNSTLSQIDSNLQRLCNDSEIQKILYQNTQHHFLSSEDQRIMRQKIMDTLNYCSEIYSVEFYTPDIPKQIYPFAQGSIFNLLTPKELRLVDEQNGKIVWFGDTRANSSYICAGKHLLLSDYKFMHGGYMVASIRPDFLDFFQKDFRQLKNSAILLTDSTGRTLYFTSSTPSLTEGSINNKDYDLVKSKSAYTDWELTICISRNILKQDIVWLNHILLLSFSIGGILFVICCVFISRMISSPIQDMKKAMFISNGKLQKNNHSYFNSDINELNCHYNELVDKNNALIQEVFEKELSKTKAEIKALQSQVNPHFIINALESMYWCLVKKGDMENSQILLSLARLFRYILKADDWITIEDEIHFIEEYLQIEHFRFGSKLEWNYSIDSSVQKILIPKLLIHPLVENAVQHAVETTSAKISIHISIHKTAQGFKIKVSDNGKGIPDDVIEQILLSFQEDKPVGSVSKSYGLANLYKRIHLYFGDSSSLSINSDSNNGGTQVTLDIRTDL